MKVTLENCSGAATFTPHVRYKWQVLDAYGVPDTGSGEFSGWQGRVKLKLPPHVQKTQTLLTFDIEDTEHNLLRSNQQVTLDTYVGYDRAKSIPEIASGPPKLAWLDRAAGWATGGAAPLDIASRLNTGIFTDGATFYRDAPAAVTWPDLLSVGGTSNVGNCSSVSDLWVATARLLGLNARMTQTFGEYDKGFVTRPGSSASFDPGQVGNCAPEFATTPDRWRFSMHQVGVLPLRGNSRFFDPTYGQEYASFPGDLILWDLRPGFFNYFGKLAQETDEGHIVYAVVLQRPSHLWDLWYFTPTNGGNLRTQQPASASGVGAQFDNAGTWASEDPNNDGQYDALRWDGSVTTVGSPGQIEPFAVFGSLYVDTAFVSERPNETAMLGAHDEVADGQPGTHAVHLRFSGEDIRQRGSNGAYRAVLWLTDSTGTIVDSVETPTPTLSAANFGERPTRIGTPTDLGLDRDESGYYDDIEVDVPLLTADTSRVNVAVYATIPGDTVQLGNVDTAFVALPGSMTVRLALPGTDFVLHGVDGPYTIHVDVQAEESRASSVEFTSQAYSIGDFDGVAVSRLGPAGQTAAIDTDGDGLADVVTWQLGVDCLRPGVYQTRAVLAASDGTPIVSTVAEDTLATGFTSILLRFPGAPMADAALDADRVISLETIKDDGVRCMAGDDFETNVTISHTLFTPTIAPYVLFGTSFSSTAVDTNSDGKYDRLVLSAQVTNTQPDSARMTAEGLLLGAQGQVITVGRGDAVAGPGATVPIGIRFDGKAIYTTGADGPYAIDQLSAVSDRDSLRFFGRTAYLAHAHTTSAYTWRQFAAAPYAFGAVGINGSLLAGAEVSMGAVEQPVVTDAAGKYRLGTPELQAGTYTIRLQLPVGQDTSGWQVYRNGVAYASGRSASVTFGATEAVRIDFFRGSPVEVTDTAPRQLLTVFGPAPNPIGMGGRSRLSFELATRSRVRIEVYDVQGRLVSRVFDGWKSAGLNTIDLTASRLRGSRGTGVYLIRLIADSLEQGRAQWNGRIVVLR